MLSARDKFARTEADRRLVSEHLMSILLLAVAEFFCGIAEH